LIVRCFPAVKDKLRPAHPQAKSIRGKRLVYHQFRLAVKKFYLPIDPFAVLGIDRDVTGIRQ